MRNLKRALSLTLASVMLLGMMVMGSSALSFNDADDISNVTAASILEELGVMQGDGKGNFMPEQTVTRAQMAIIICRIMFGNRLNVDTLATEGRFTDVAPGEYYTGFVNFAAEQGIIGGYGDGRFGPDDTVTTAQAALMLCRGLGYYKAGEDKGDWANVSLNAISLATKLKMFGDLRLGTNDLLARDNVAEMVFNTMTKAVPVMYNATWNLYYTDSQNVLGGTSFDYLNSWGFQNYDLVYKIGEDAFDRPTTKWGVGSVSGSGATDAKGDLIDSSVTLKNSIIEVEDNAAYTYTSKVTWRNVANDIGRSTANGYDWTVNGNVASPDWTNDDDAIADDGIETGNGVLTQIYLVSDEGHEKTQAKMFIIPTYVAKVDGDYDKDDKELTLKSLEEDGAVEVPADSLVLSADDFDNLDSFADGDYVLVTVADGVIETVSKAEVITGDVDGYVADKNVTVDKNRYSYTKGFEGPADDYKLNSECELVMDKYGYVIFADNVEADGSYVYVSDAGKLQGVGGGVEVELILTDGSKVIEQLHKDSYEADNDPGITEDQWNDPDGTNNEANKITGWFKYSMKGGKYVLKDDGNIEDAKSVTDGLEITKAGRASVQWAGGSMPANSGTTFIVKRGDTITVYNGVRNVSDVKAKGTEATVQIVEDDGYAKYVMIVGTKNDLTSTSTAASERIFIADAENYENSKDGDTELYTYEAVVNGKVQTITSTGNDWTVGLYTDISYDGKYVESGTKVDDDSEDDVKAYEVSEKNISFSKDVLSWVDGSIVLAEGCKLWTTDGDDLKSVTASKLASDYKVETFSGSIYLVIEDDMAIEVYVDKSEAGGVTPPPAEFPVVTHGEAAVTLADGNSAGTDGKVAASADVVVGTLSANGEADINVTLKSGGLIVANDDTIAFELTCEGAVIAGDDVADGTVTLTKAGGDWADSTVTVTKGEKTSTYTVKVTEASTDAGISAGEAEASTTDATATVGNATTPSNGTSTIAVTFTDTNSAVAEGDTITFTITPEEGVTLRDAEQDGTVTVTLTYTSGSWGQEEVVATAPAGNTVTYTISVS